MEWMKAWLYVFTIKKLHLPEDEARRAPCVSKVESERNVVF